MFLSLNTVPAWNLLLIMLLVLSVFKNPIDVFPEFKWNRLSFNSFLASIFSGVWEDQPVLAAALNFDSHVTLHREVTFHASLKHFLPLVALVRVFQILRWNFDLIAFCFQELISFCHCRVAPPTDTGSCLVHGSTVQSSFKFQGGLENHKVVTGYIYRYLQCLC